MTRVDGAWFRRAETRAVLELLETAGHRAYLVGGCVRDALLDRPVKDIDVATDAHPQEVVALAGKAEIQAVPTGLDHGTVTLVLNGVPYEVTTFRRDIETDGRHAVVAFSGDITEDAMRRDLTINALYADRNGVIQDPVGTGVVDLENGVVRFVGDPELRIREDYLRSLRFFRFLAGYGDPDAGVDRDALAAISANLAGLDTLAAERVGHEMRRLLGAPNPAPALAAMAQSGVLVHVLPGADVKAIGPLVHLEGLQRTEPDWIRRLAALGGDDVVDRLRLSKVEARTFHALRTALSETAGNAELAYRLGQEAAWNVALVLAAVSGAPLDGGARTEIEKGAKAKFPVAAADLMPILSGPDLGACLDTLERRWIASGFELTREDLLGDLPGG